MSPGNIVARFELAAPGTDAFLLHGTIPVPPGVLHPADDTLPIAVVQNNGQPVETQVEIVSRFANPADGADVVELIAQVRRPEGAAPGDRIQFAVEALDEPVPKPPRPEPSLNALTDLTDSVPGSVLQLLADPDSIELVTRDVHGHAYRTFPLQAGEAPRLLRHGSHHSQLATYGTMLSADSGPGVLPHLFGVHAYVSTLREEPVVLLDLRVHNGFANTDPASDIDDVLGEVYFDQLDLRVPEGWTVVSCFEDSGLGTPALDEGEEQTVVPLVDANSDGSLHYWPMGGQMVRRLALCPEGDEVRAREILDQEGLAFAVASFDANSLQETWSWSNRATARFLVQNVPLPDLEHANLAYIRGLHAADLASLTASLESGLGDGGYPLQHGKLGWAHPYGVAYGGMTGGNEIHLFEAVDTVQARSVDGYRHYQLLHRMHTDRQPNVLYRRDGRHASLWDWFVDDGATPHVPLAFYMKHLNGPDPIGVKSPPNAHTEAVQAAGLLPAYREVLAAYEPHDLQHLIRYTRSPKALVWIGNDQLAKDDLLAQAELVRLSYHPYPWNEGGSAVVTGMLDDIEQTLAKPGSGVDFGRGEGWATDTRVAAYALADDEWRAGEYPQLETMAEMLARGQVPCTGHILAFWSPKVLDGKYRSAQAYETSIVDNGIRGLLETVFRGRSESLTALTEKVLRGHYYGFIGPTGWSSVHNGPIEQYAVAPKSELAPAFCGPFEQPADGKFDGANKYQTWSTLGYGYLATGDPLFLTRAEQMIGGDLEQTLLDGGIGNIQNRAVLLSAVQMLQDAP